MFVVWNFCPYWAYMGTIVTALYNFTSDVCQKICSSLEQPFLGVSLWRDVMCDALCMLGAATVWGLIDCIILVPKWTSAGRKDVISLPLNQVMCRQLQIITSLPVCAKRTVRYVRHWNNLFWGCLHGMTLCATGFVC